MDSPNPQIMFQQESEIHKRYLTFQPSEVKIVDLTKVIESSTVFARCQLLNHFHQDATTPVKPRDLDETQLRQYLEQVINVRYLRSNAVRDWIS